MTANHQHNNQLQEVSGSLVGQQCEEDLATPSGRPLSPLAVSAEQREQLRSWSRRAKTAQALALRSRIVLLAGDGLANKEIARRQGCSQPTAGKGRQRFIDLGVDGLLDEPRPGAPRRLSDQQVEQVEQVLTRTLESRPEAATHGSTRAPAKAYGLSQSTVSRIWRAFSLAPHRSETFKLSRDPLFIEKVRDIVGLYLAPPDRALVLCVDEKSQAGVPASGLCLLGWRSRRSIAPPRCCPCGAARSNGAPTMTHATAPPASSPRSTPGPARSSARPSSGIAPASSATSSTPSKKTSPRN